MVQYYFLNFIRLSKKSVRKIIVVFLIFLFYKKQSTKTFCVIIFQTFLAYSGQIIFGIVIVTVITYNPCRYLQFFEHEIFHIFD